MAENENRYRKYSDENDDAYYCPADWDAGNGIAAEGIPDSCIEADVVGRYAGNIDVVEPAV